ncbi:hypothetical protein VB715_06095 [Crocosphaera sp. UHCC 0190]|uniref:hypothetical protein n=1 Tax=Crocosphaera sp. UHCC 0190 TaxID=3110246 RepID=UPI002B1F9F0A|nr:hypothetical protein [Crocosphaera sp. UHCC 0190]MEA5509333.1 hypothetical protein [Crocosphaera sp. UHCC 0190]
MKKTHKALTTLAVVLMGLGTVTLAQQASMAADPFKDFYDRNCVPEAQKAGLSKSEAQQGCTCTVNSLKKKYSTQAFSALLTKHRSGDAAATRTLRAYGETCFDKILDNLLFEN